jgi:hypothetical protein
MKPNEFIQQKLNSLKNKDSLVVSGGKIEDQIIKFLMSKKFRKYSTNPEYLDHIRSAIRLNIAKNEPIKLTLVFGGYKLWRLKESPEVDWAELFSLIYYTNWLKPICSIYKPGVWFDFYSDDVILEIMDNVPKKDTEQYAIGFKKLLGFIKPYLPKNLNITFHRVGDQYESYEGFKKELYENIKNIEKELRGLPKLTPEQIDLVDLNVKLKPDQDSDSNWREKVFLIHEAYSRVLKRRPYYRTEDKIFAITRQMKDSIAVGTTKTSVVKFWIGAGALKKTPESYIEYILSPKQLESGDFELVDCKLNDLDLKNFQTIRLLK